METGIQIFFKSDIKEIDTFASVESWKPNWNGPGNVEIIVGSTCKWGKVFPKQRTEWAKAQGSLATE
jgi:hypothetical protein